MGFYDKIYDVCNKVDSKLREGGVYADVYPYGSELPVFVVDIHWGDWKHDHARAKWLIEQMGGYHLISSVVTEDNGSDCYSAEHRFYIADFCGEGCA